MKIRLDKNKDKNIPESIHKIIYYEYKNLIYNLIPLSPFQ